MTKPFFSVVMPTRNRCDLLSLAIQSVLGQTFGDFELIVSDNFSEDYTSDVVKTFGDPRIKYVRSERSLSIGDSYDFALGHAKGEYITFLSDDDAYVSGLLKRNKQILDVEKPEAITFRFAHYCHTADFFYNRNVPANTLVFPDFTGKLTKFSSVQANELLYQYFGLNNVGRNDDFVMPFLSNVIYHHSVFARIKAVKNDLFASTPADIYSTAALFNVIDEYYCLDEPLYVWSHWSDNTTASAGKKGNDLREHYVKLLNGEKLVHTPLKYELPENCSINTILQCQHDFGKDNSAYVDWGTYYVHSYDNLMNLRNLGVDVTNELSEFNTVLALESAEVQHQVRSRINAAPFVLKQHVRKFQPVIRLAKRLIGRDGKQIYIDGKKGGFGDVLGAAKELSKKISLS